METEKTANLFSGLGQPTRLEILRVIAPYSKGPNGRGLPAGEISKALDLAPATLSFHLKDMSYKDLVLTHREGRKIYYRTNTVALLQTLDEFVTAIVDPATP